ncbi:L-2-amino-thiazoline-4-carboxylic acid hydrolase [Jutongia sp.]|uniref:L-2-amino-thiazoline-4-carboxylic acid hydrolase n=1 Tax=Jutongia sp. TaxID=2944204 RepID=UPI0030799320
MKNTFSVRLIYHFYHNAVKAELKKRGFPKNTSRKIAKEHKIILDCAKDIGKSNLLSSYIMGSYFIALNRSTSRSAEENYEIFRDGLCASKLFHKIMGNADSYLDPKRIPARRQWSEDSHKRKYENDWVVDILPGNDEYDLGYDYHECGICKLCQDEGCPELAAYLCRMDYVLADIMNMKLVRTGTIAEGASCCDFRYSKPR